jgi:hypothetical protein
VQNDTIQGQNENMDKLFYMLGVDRVLNYDSKYKCNLKDKILKFNCTKNFA